MEVISNGCFPGIFEWLFQLYLDLLLRCFEKVNQKSSPVNGGQFDDESTMVQSVKHHQKKQIHVCKLYPIHIHELK